MKLTYRKLMQDVGANKLNETSSSSLDGLKKRTKQYIFLQKVLSRIEELLAPEETIQAYLPLGNDRNSVVASSGWAGLAYARKDISKEYVAIFHDTRGNRLLIFTNQRLIFLTIIDFLEEDSYFSHPYADIKQIKLAPYELRYFDWQKKPKRQKMTYYILDFQAGQQIFQEILSEEDAQVFQDNLQKIPLLNLVPVSKKVQRETLFDYIFSNTSLAYKIIFTVFTIGPFCLLVLLIILLLQGALGDSGPYAEFFRNLHP
ncbi:hypothetical protein [Enterococcus sp. HY326]|uniref:hypothetical protein n=1 Tax=Enterococcus sp. HY326 TaxID=2971265 RepID=UPI00223F6FA0|nr:hypothetical protein [Enterococcus sp. HY326]